MSTNNITPYNKFTIWFSTVSIILILFGVLYCFAGLKVFVKVGIIPVNKDVLIDWESALYGAIMIGWGTTIFLLGRIAFRRQDKELMRILLLGIILWLLIEAIFSFYLGVYFNVGVDVVVGLLFSYPIIKAIRQPDKAKQ